MISDKTVLPISNSPVHHNTIKCLRKFNAGQDVETHVALMFKS